MGQKKIAFICPMDEEHSEIRNRSDDIYENVLKVVGEKLDYVCDRADDKDGATITQNIREMLYDADIVIADLTGSNPNVYYELGLFHAIKGDFIAISQSDKKAALDLPFDVKDFWVIPYEYPASRGSYNKFEERITKRIQKLQKESCSPFFEYSPEDVANFFGATVVVKRLTSKQDHYTVAIDMLKKPCKEIFLMQRSSSVILGAEQDWDKEGEFLSALRQAIETCSDFKHIISLEGIRAHLSRQTSEFPDFVDFSKNLVKIGRGNTGIRKNPNSGNNRNFTIKRLPSEGMGSKFFKEDRQARVLAIRHFDGSVQAGIVHNLGPEQSAFLIKGSTMDEYLKECQQYYRDCKSVKWQEIVDLYEEYCSN
jgi:hypothetical protein